MLLGTRIHHEDLSCSVAMKILYCLVTSPISSLLSVEKVNCVSCKLEFSFKNYSLHLSPSTRKGWIFKLLNLP